MVRVCRWLVFLTTLFVGVPVLFAAASEKDFDDSALAFRVGLWRQATNDFAEFVRKYPNSPRVPEAILYDARARYHLRRFAEAAELLSANQTNAGPAFADQYLFWIGQAHFEDGNFQAAAAAFEKLVNEFPDSRLRLDSVVREATARARSGDWPLVVRLLEAPDGVFQQAAQASSTNEAVPRGYLVLGEAQLAQTNFSGVTSVIESLNGSALSPDLAWRRQFLQCRLLRAQGQTEAALQNLTNLIASANATNRAEGISFRADTCEQLGQLDDAISAHELNIGSNTPAVYRRYALQKIADLSALETNRMARALNILQDYLAQFSQDSTTDQALLALGELELKQCVSIAGTGQSGAGVTNLCDGALGRFETLLTTFPNSPLSGKALLDKGWCLWTQEKYPESEEAFRLAVARLALADDRSDARFDQAVARFKWADAQFKQGNFSAALDTYHLFTAYDASVPGVQERLLEQALYQSARAALNVGNWTALTNALQKIWDWYPNGFAGDHCLLLAGQKLAQNGDTTGARKLFQEIEAHKSARPLLPRVRLAVARSYEQENPPNWNAAMTNYDDWINTFTNNADLPRAMFSRAWVDYMAGQETNALTRFTNFVARFSTNEPVLAPQAQWWIGDFYFRHGDFPTADKSYQWIFKNTNWSSSPLIYEAQMQAGRAAAANMNYTDAIDYYFTPLATDTNCPQRLRAQARFAWADSLMSRDFTNKPRDLKNAIELFKQIPTNSDLAVLALGREANCYWLLARDTTNSQDYSQAFNAYQQVISQSNAPVAARNQATVGLGIISEALAQQQKGGDQADLFNQALGYYLKVFSDREADPNWRRNAGNNIITLAQRLRLWDQAINVCRELQTMFPSARPQLEAIENRLQLEKARPAIDSPATAN